MTFPLLAACVLAVALAAGVIAHLTNRFLIVALCGAAAITFLHGWLYFHYTSDDAYISYRYALNFSEGRGLEWNPGEYVEGYSNFLWVVLLGAIHRLGGDLVVSGRWLGFAFAVGGAGATYALVQELIDDAKTARYAGLAAALLLAACGPWAFWSTAGLEGTLAGTLIGCAVLVQLREGSQRYAKAGVLWGLAALARPDVLLLIAVAGLWVSIDHVRGARAGASSTRRAATYVGSWMAGVGALVVPHVAWRYVTYGYVLPNTYYAKVGSGIDQYDRGLQYAMGFAQEYAAWSLLLVATAAIVRAIRADAAALLLALVLVWIAGVVYVGGDSLLARRLFVPILPLYYAATVAAGAGLLKMLFATRERSRRLFGALAAVLVAAAMSYTLASSASGGDQGDFVKPSRDYNEQRVELGRWLRSNVPEDTLIAVWAAGAIPYESRLSTIDMLGLNDEHIAHTEIEDDPTGASGVAGHEKYDTAYVLSRRPEIIIIHDGITAEPASERDYLLFIALGDIPALDDMLSNAEFGRNYARRSVELRPGSWINLLVRNDAAAVLEVTQRSP